MPPLPSKDLVLYIHNRWTSTTVSDDFFSFFVCNIQKLIVWCISSKENYYNLTKNSRNFQTSATERCTSLSEHSEMFRQNLFKVPVKKSNL